MESPGGFTLIEMLLALALLALAGSLAMPTFRLLQLDAVRTREVNQFVQAVHLARGEALKRNVVVSLCPSADARACAAAGTPWHSGWIVFANRDGDTPADRDPGEPLLRAYPAWRDGRILANRDFLSFRAFGQSGVTSTYVFCDERGTAGARAVIISQTGRPRLADRTAAGTALACS